MAGQGLPKIKLWEISFAVFHLALRFDPFLLLACYLEGDLDFSQKHFNDGDKLKHVMCGGMNAGFRETM